VVKRITATQIEISRFMVQSFISVIFRVFKSTMASVL
jgi:hypothetical protein